MKTFYQYRYVIPATFVVAFILTLLPMPNWALWLCPAWVLMALIYWSMTVPEYINLGTAWFIGLFLDVLLGTTLGEHALALTIPLFFVVRRYTRLRMFPLLQQSLCIFLLTLVYLLVLFGIQGFIDTAPTNHLFWLSALTTMILWPWVYGLLRRFTYTKLV